VKKRWPPAPESSLPDDLQFGNGPLSLAIVNSAADKRLTESRCCFRGPGVGRDQLALPATQNRAVNSGSEHIDSAVSRIPALDGLRGTAILLVILCHVYIFGGVKAYLDATSWKPLWGIAQFGWCGVELFFVLSGFLITSILFNTKESPKYFKSFYGRRAVRIFPLYFAVLLIYFYGPVSLFHVYRFEPTHKIWFFTYLANWKAGFWRVDELTLFWSLCVEEQFYLVWPLVVWITGYRTFPWLCLGVIVVSLAAGIGIEFARVPELVVWCTSVPRLQAIVFGSLLAWVVRQPWLEKVTGYLKLAIPASFGLMLVCALQPPYFRSLHTLEFLISAVAWSALVLRCCTRSDGLAARIMRNRILRSFGKYSYAIYVLHACVMFYVANFTANMLKRYTSSRPLILIGAFATVFAATYLAGFLSWHLFEKHFLRLKKYFLYQVSSRVPSESKTAPESTLPNNQPVAVS
jgi:peptidoglycan/LPS O-acetylase OafA/YrhL